MVGLPAAGMVGVEVGCVVGVAASVGTGVGLGVTAGVLVGLGVGSRVGVAPAAQADAINAATRTATSSLLRTPSCFRPRETTTGLQELLHHPKRELLVGIPNGFIAPLSTHTHWRKEAADGPRSSPL